MSVLKLHGFAGLSPFDLLQVEPLARQPGSITECIQGLAVDGYSIGALQFLLYAHSGTAVKGIGNPFFVSEGDCLWYFVKGKLLDFDSLSRL